MATLSQTKSPSGLVISWEALPDDFQLEDEPVENTGQPLLAGALRESLELAGFIQPQMLIASNFALCATINFPFIRLRRLSFPVASVIFKSDALTLSVGIRG